MPTEPFTFRGLELPPDWPARLREAQAVTAYRLRGEFYERIRYGNERGDWGANDHPCDCAAVKGELHVPGCCVEACPRCKGQYISCGCADHDEY